MPRLPSALQPLWPVVKRVHRMATRTVGAANRAAPARAKGGPRSGCDYVTALVARESGASRLHVISEVEHLDRPMPRGLPAGHWIFDTWGRFDVAPRYLVEHQGGTVVGDYAAVISADGYLDYESSTYFGVNGWREHPVFLRSRLPEPTDIAGNVLCLATRGSSANYYHFLLDVLPRWGVFQEADLSLSPDVLHVNARTGYQRQMLALLGLDSLPMIEPGPQVSVRARNLLVPCIPNPELMAPTWTTTWLRNSLPAQQRERRPRRIYITRGSARNSRRVVNEAALISLLGARGFEIFDPGQRTVQEQIDHFAAAEVIVAPHGAALANLVFASPGVKVLELFAPNYVNPCYWALAMNIPQVDYRYLICGPDRRRVGASQNGVLTDISVDINLFTATLHDMLGS